MSRRVFLAATIGGGLGLTACGRPAAPARSTPTSVSASANPLSEAINAAEAARPHTGRTVTAALTPRAAGIDLGGPIAHTLAFGTTVPGPLIRANVGDELAVTVTNGLDRPTSVHWHGIALRNDMDGVEPATPNIAAGQQFTYRFSAPHPGTYWAHPHVTLDTDYGLYLPVIIDDPTEPGAYDAEWILILDDWTDGVGKSPQQIYDGLRQMGQMQTSTVVGNSALLGGDAGHVLYPYYLINGRIPTAPATLRAKPAQRIRVRIINAGSDTAFRVALAGHSMTVTHTDGFPVAPTTVDALLIGMGERYDVIVTAGDGVFPLVALAEGKNALARALLSTGAGTAPDPAFQPTELTGRIGTVAMFSATPPVDLGTAKADVSLRANLSGSIKRYDWAINGKQYPHDSPLTIKQGQRATLTFANATMMWHPMHLHGHTFQVMDSHGALGPRKDTTIVLPMREVSVALVADNPGIWMMHCHNTYHQEAGMMTTLNYTG
ncbi:multicopper oxidase family protein [Mycobacterium parmense]|nr:multicopper oxidase family protein [Mycobacterium parmense]